MRSHHAKITETITNVPKERTNVVPRSYSWVNKLMDRISGLQAQHML